MCSEFIKTSPFRLAVGVEMNRFDKFTSVVDTGVFFLSSECLSLFFITTVHMYSVQVLVLRAASMYSL